MKAYQFLEDRVAVVTGSGRGIGRAIALFLGQEGCRVVVNALRPEAGTGEATASEIVEKGGRADVFYGDVSDYKVAKRLIRRAIDKFGRIDILVNNAGLSSGVEVREGKAIPMPWDLSEESWDRMIRVNMKGTYNCTRHASGFMKDQRWGRIINCTSGSWIGRAGSCHYAAAKAGIVGLTRTVAIDMAPFGVTCNAYHPYAVTDARGAQTVYTVEQRFKAGKIDREEYEWQINPPGPEGVGPLIAYLATEEAGHINGKVFYVSGGKIAVYSEPARMKTIFKKEGIWSLEELMNQIPTMMEDSNDGSSDGFKTF